MRLSLIVLFSITIFCSCAKKQNRKSIEGDWTLIQLDGTYYNTGNNPLHGTFTFNHKLKKCEYSMDVIVQLYDSIGAPSGFDTIHQVGEWAYEVEKSAIRLNDNKWTIDLLNDNNFNISRPSFDQIYGAGNEVHVLKFRR